MALGLSSLVGSPTGRLVLILALGAPLAACGGKGFITARDYGRVAECYAAFMSVSMDASDPALGFSDGQIGLQEQVSIQGVNRLSPYTVKAIRTAGGDHKFLILVASWRLKPENDIAKAATLEAKKAVYQHVLVQASRCHTTLTGWGAKLDGRLN